MIIKVCGLNNAENLLHICNIGIDMVGYNFYEPSARYLTVPMPEIPTHIAKIGVFVNASVETIQEKKGLYGLDFAQLHGDESPEFARSLKSFIKVIKVFRIDDDFDPETLQLFSFCDYYLFDTATIHFGGSGHKFDWKSLHSYNIKKPFLLSGGISPKDIEDVLKLSHPKFAGVDINSKFEASPGVKDVKMVREFVDALRKGKTNSKAVVSNKSNKKAILDPKSLKGLSSRLKNNKKEHSPFGAGGAESKNDQFVEHSPLGAGGAESNKKASLDPKSLKGLSSRLKNNKKEHSPSGVGLQSNEKASLDPKSLKGLSSRLKNNKKEPSPLGVEGAESKNDQFVEHSPLGAGGAESKNDQFVEHSPSGVGLQSNKKASLDPKSLKGLSSRLKNNKKEHSPSGVGLQSNEKPSLDPKSLKGLSSRLKNNKKEHSPSGVGLQSNEKPSLDPKSLKGLSSRLKNNKKEPSPLGVEGAESKNDQFVEHSPLGAGGLVSNEKPSLDPKSLQGLSSRSKKNIKEPSIGGKKDKIDKTLDSNMFYGASALIFENASFLRRHMTKEEQYVWDFLKSKPDGIKFRRQHPINIYIADFYAHALKLVIEIDGNNHKYSKNLDNEREQYFNSLQIRTIRFLNEDISNSFFQVKEKILKEIRNEQYFFKK